MLESSLLSNLGKIPFVIRFHRFLYRLIKPKTVNVLGMKLYVNPEDKVLSDSLIQDGVWEALETKYVTGIIKKGWTVLDVGANIGYYTLIFSKLVGETGKVFAFEPDPENFALLKRNVEENFCKNVVLVKKALSNITGKTKLFIDEENKGDHKTYDTRDGRKSIIVDSVSLDDFFINFKGKINFIKIDIQGGECLAFLGMKKLLSKQKNISIISEYWPYGLSNSGINPQDYIMQLRKSCFSLFQLDKITGKAFPLNDEKLSKEFSIENRDYANLYGIKSKRRLILTK